MKIREQHRRNCDVDPRFHNNAELGTHSLTLSDASSRDVF